MTQLFYSKEARDKILSGVNKIADAVKVTLGANGRNVIIAKEAGKLPLITKDGVTVANYVRQLEDPLEDIGAQIIKEAARKTMIAVGDGTTTATVLAQAIIKEGLKYIDDGANPMELKKGIDRAVEIVVKNLESQSRKVNGDMAITRAVATLSANGDSNIGELIAEALDTAGQDGLVYIDESKTSDTHISISEGLHIDRGFIHPVFVNNPQKMRVEFKDAYILMCDKKLSRINELTSILNAVMATKKPLLIISEDVEGEALYTLGTNCHKIGAPFCAIKSPSTGSIRKEMLEDIATITGGVMVSEEKGYSLQNITLKQLGIAASVVVSKDQCIITGGAGAKQDVSKRIEQARTQLAECSSEFEKPLYAKRLAILTCSMVVIHVGGTTEVEMKERKDRVDDALHATKAAIEGGVVPGGGLAYLRSIKSLREHKCKGDFEKGLVIVEVALGAPCNQIGLNAGLLDRELVLTNEETHSSFGYNVKTEEIEDFFATGVLDPLKVSITALENAASVASLFLTTECAIVEK